MGLSAILYVIALILFVLGAIPLVCRFNLVSAGLACVTLAFILSAGLLHG